MGAASAQPIHLCPPSCGPGFDPQAQPPCFIILYLDCDDKITKINKKPNVAQLYTDPLPYSWDWICRKTEHKY